MKLLRAATLAMFSILFFTTASHAQSAKRSSGDINIAARAHWVDSVYNKLTEEERIGQLFMVAAYSGTKKYNDELVTKLINAHQVGGLIFMQGGPARQAELTNKYQAMAQVPLLLSMDAEWGLGMRLDSVNNFPRQMMIGATHDTALAYRMGMAIAYQCKRLGVTIDFAPDVDVNNNSGNPVINSRSFGEDKTWVAKLGIAYMKGLQDNGVIACAKHFPGHGDTNVDSHKDLPLILKSLAQLDTLELYPFKKLIAAGVKSVMIAHLDVPSLDTAAHVPTTLSKNTVTNLLKNTLGFKGLVFTDALNMQGVTKYFSNGDAELRAFEAGNDVLLFTQDVPVALAKIKTAIDSGKIPMDMLETSVKKILSAKYDVGLTAFKPIKTENIVDDLNQFVDPIRTQIARAAITVVRDDNGILPKINENTRISYVGLNAARPTTLYNALNDKFDNIQATWVPKGTPGDTIYKVLDKIAKNELTIVAVHNVSFYPGNDYGLGDDALYILQQLETKSNVMVVLLGNAYAMQNFCNEKSILVSYEDDSLTELAVADVLLKKIKAKGRLPVTACGNGYIAAARPAPPRQQTGTQLNNTPYELTKTLIPSEAGVKDPTALDKLDMFLQRDIADGVFPGCRVLAAKDGKVFYDKAFGYYKYDKIKAVDTNTLYDMASCTKVLATTLAIMRLYEDGKIDLSKTLGYYLPWVKGTDKAGLHIKDVLLHQAGLKSWIPFYKETLDANGKLKKDLFRDAPWKTYSIPVARDLYLRNDYKDTIWNRILTSPLENTGKYVYSDLDFYFLAAIVKQITGLTIDQYADQQFYKPMGLTHITYTPLAKFDTMQIAPTEDDIFFRHQVLQGFVHDQGAALLGGVAGHAGIFATAGDVGAIFQMLLNKGVYRNKRYFSPETIALFTAYNSTISHRGLGFDKPAMDADNGGPAGDRTSGLAFGHQGFTGTCVWADPATGVVFVFLSNRVYPSADNGKINHLNVRTVAQDYIYEALGIPVNHDRPELYKAQTTKK